MSINEILDAVRGEQGGLDLRKRRGKGMIDKQESGETKVQRSGMKHWFWNAVDWVGDRVSEHPIVARIAYSGVMVMGAVSVLLEGHRWYASLGWFIAVVFMVLADMESECGIKTFKNVVNCIRCSKRSRERTRTFGKRTIA